MFDGLGNILLGIVLIVFPARLATRLGIANVGSGFYGSLFGAVLVGIGIALLLERAGPDGNTRGLGLVGALIINLCFGVALAGWILFGSIEPDLPGGIA